MQVSQQLYLQYLFLPITINLQKIIIVSREMHSMCVKEHSTNQAIHRRHTKLERVRAAREMIQAR